MNSTVRWLALALLGVAIAAGVSIAASRLASQQIGLASQPISAGDTLVPHVSHRPGAHRHPQKTAPPRTPTTQTTTVPQPPPVPAPTTPAAPTTPTGPSRSGGGEGDGGGGATTDPQDETPASSRGREPRRSRRR